MAGAFEKTSIKGLELENRFVRSATWEGLADEEGRAGDELPKMLAALARGGVGLVITGFAYVSRAGKALPHQTGAHRDDLIPGLARTAEAVHAAGGKTIVQLVHGGLQTDEAVCGEVPAGPSAVRLSGVDPRVRELSAGEIQEIVEDFGRAAARVKSAGFDGVQLHLAHGYLLNQFLSPFFNKRGDRYGGGLPNRARISYEAYEAVRGAVGEDFPVLVKLNSEDCVEGGLTLEDSLKVAQNLAEMGLDAIEVSGGHRWSRRLGPARTKIANSEDEAYFRPAARVFKSKVRVPIMLVGGLRSPGVIDEILAAREADYIAMSRPLIRQPDLVKTWAEGDRTPAACISCNGCFESARGGRGVSCTVLEKQD
ncbi:MAG: NADH:flavin oxidoreductase [Pseudomonadota bacterium]